MSPFVKLQKSHSFYSFKGQSENKDVFMNSSKADNLAIRSFHPESNNILNEPWILYDQTFI